ncbi:hypothetical protein CLG96_02540 [Sphingomonas oleivorans]|uniref:Xylose isomerase n=1 Tax=Sphingomonas oleivorans TaxID=1735121 RepID=A0A2T5G1K0_9SPHN|nr:metabolite traffic protein EboE [Sphingomonas oleivorans]PTQ13037.1 hypothetical protein CLG96_02540 [Sphingomonas oleivorans]
MMVRPDEWLGYCLNVHPTQSFAEVRAALLGPVRELKRRLAPDRPFGVGLRMSAEALAHPDAAGEIKAIFAAEGFAAYTMNGFPYGRFHGAPVKEAVYEPDWSSRARLNYSLGLAELMAALVPEGAMATISTVPGGYAERVGHKPEEIAEVLLRAAAHLVRLERRTGRRIALAVEPEPSCLMETVADAVAFFRAHLLTDGAARRLAALADISPAEAAQALPRHLGLCLDVCHMAVGFEDAGEAVAALRAAGIAIHKLQLSAALRIDHMDARSRSRLAAFQDEIYLHQVVARTADGGLRSHLDLPQALALGEASDGEAWHIHFHVPLFADLAPPLGSTRDVLEQVLALHRAEPLSSHLEVETYTWDVLPPEVHPEGIAGGPIDIIDGIERELRWAHRQLS